MRWSRPAFPWAPLIALPATLAILLIWQCSCGTPAAIPLMAVGVPSVPIPDPATTSTTHRLAALAMTGARILAGGSWLALLLLDVRRYLTTLIWTGIARFRTRRLPRILHRRPIHRIPSAPLPASDVARTSVSATSPPPLPRAGEGGRGVRVNAA